MTKKEPRLQRTLRALRGQQDPDPTEAGNHADPDPALSPGDSAAEATTTDPAQAPSQSVDDLEDAVATLEAKLESGDGIDGLAAWLREVEDTLKALKDSDLDHTRDDIRSVIDRLLGINAEIQNVVRLKKLLS